MAGGRTKGNKQGDYGSKIELIDRRREAWALRARGLSFRQIGENLGIAPFTAWKDCKKAEEEWGEIYTDPQQLREGLLELHAQVSGHLMRQLEHQAQHGQVTDYSDDKGNRSRTVRHWVNPQVAAECGRNLQRMAALMGLSDGSGIDGATGNQQQNTVVIVSPPTDGASFEAKYASPAIDVAAEPGRTTAPEQESAEPGQ